MDDLISRQAAIVRTSKVIKDDMVANDVKEVLKHLPSAQPGRMRGKWRHYEGELECDQCGASFYDEIMELCGDDVPKYCPDCGADMGGEQDDR